MSQVKQALLDGIPITGLFEKSRTEGDEFRFVSAETGHSQIIHRDDVTKVQAFLAATPPYYQFTLNFKYIVGRKQICVDIVEATTGRTYPLLSLADIQEARSDSSWPSPAIPDLNVSTILHYSEVSDSLVRVYNLATNKLLWFHVPHTSLPAASRSRLIVESQGDGIAEEYMGDGNGLLLRSRNGTRGLVTIDDELNLRVDPR